MQVIEREIQPKLIVVKNSKLVKRLEDEYAKRAEDATIEKRGLKLTRAQRLARLMPTLTPEFSSYRLSCFFVKIQTQQQIGLHCFSGSCERNPQSLPGTTSVLVRSDCL